MSETQVREQLCYLSKDLVQLFIVNMLPSLLAVYLMRSLIIAISALVSGLRSETSCGRACGGSVVRVLLLDL